MRVASFSLVFMPLVNLFPVRGEEDWRFGAVNSTLPVFLQLVPGRVRLR